MSFSFPQFSVDEIILRHGSQDLYFMIIHSNITLTTASSKTAKNIFKGSDRLCKVVELCMQCCGKLLSDSFETY